MKAMILAAGLGTRLRPFTLEHPKALFEYNGQTLLRHALEHLRSAGISEIIVNVHHFANQIVDYLELNKNFDCKLTISDETDALLETGGGLSKASWYFRDGMDFIVRNVDIISDLDLRKMANFHKQSNSIATLAVRDRKTSRYFLFDQSMQLCGWENRNSNEKILIETIDNKLNREPISSFAFSGIQILNPTIFQLITEHGKFSLTSLYLRLAKDNKISGYLEDGNVWKDIGSQKP
jgi:NDP-sugar pyrophosphorylase family protein